jgi:hypothetical protein
MEEAVAAIHLQVEAAVYFTLRKAVNIHRN